MNSVWNRLNAIFSYAITLLVIAAFLSSFTHYFLAEKPDVTIKYKGLQKANPRSQNILRHLGDLNDGEEALAVQFDLDADLTPAWTWSTKQLFVYLVANFETSDNKKHTVALWDKIITKKEDAHISLKDEMSEYFLVEKPQLLSSKKVTLTLSWNVVPRGGLLFDSVSGSESFRFPVNFDKLPEEHRSMTFW